LNAPVDNSSCSSTPEDEAVTMDGDDVVIVSVVKKMESLVDEYARVKMALLQAADDGQVFLTTEERAAGKVDLLIPRERRENEWKEENTMPSPCGPDIPRRRRDGGGDVRLRPQPPPGGREDRCLPLSRHVRSRDKFDSIFGGECKTPPGKWDEIEEEYFASLLQPPPPLSPPPPPLALDSSIATFRVPFSLTTYPVIAAACRSKPIFTKMSDNKLELLAAAASSSVAFQPISAHDDVGEKLPVYRRPCSVAIYSKSSNRNNVMSEATTLFSITRGTTAQVSPLERADEIEPLLRFKVSSDSPSVWTPPRVALASVAATRADLKSPSSTIACYALSLPRQRLTSCSLSTTVRRREKLTSGVVKHIGLEGGAGAGGGGGKLL
jgi:hypothetical protein